MCLCESETTDGLTVLLFCDVHIDVHRRDTELTTVPAYYLCMQRQTDQQCGDITCMHCWLCIATVQYNQLRLAPSIP